MPREYYEKLAPGDSDDTGRDYHPGSIHRMAVNVWLLDERYFVQRCEALGIAERTVLGLDVHRAAGRDMNPPFRGAAQIEWDIDIGHRAKRHVQSEGLRIASGGGDGASEVHNAVGIPRGGGTGAERGVRPAVDQVKVGERDRGEPSAVQRREALGIAERTVLGLDVHHATGSNVEPTIGCAAQIDGDVDIGKRR